MANLDPQNRLNYAGDLEGLLSEMVESCDIGEVKQLTYLPEGYEDCNIKVDTSVGSYVWKFFADSQLGDHSKTRRNPDVADRLVSIIAAVRDNGAQAPHLIASPQNEKLFRSDGLVAMAYEWINGESYFDLDRAPTTVELEEIVEQAARINTTAVQPPYYHDIWAVPHFEALFTKVKPFLNAEELELLNEVGRRFKRINLDQLPKCLVHGDFTKGNVLVDKGAPPSIIDFSVTNWTTRIIELIIIISNLMFEESDERPLQERVDLVVGMYQKHNSLTDTEVAALYDACLAGSAMELMGSRWRQNFLHDDSEEVAYWLKLGREGLKKELNHPIS